MRAVRHYAGEPGARLDEVPARRPGSGEVLLEVSAAGVCGTDVSIAFGSHGSASGAGAVTLGHEIAGRITAVGEGVEEWSVGDAVVVCPIVSCGRCRACVRGSAQICARRRVIGIDIDGGLADQVVVPAGTLVRLPDGIAPEAGAILTDAVATPFHALADRAQLRPGESIAVFGIGGLGQHAVQLARLFGAGRVVAIDTRPEALTLAGELGADAVVDARESSVAEAIRATIGGDGADVVADFTGANTAIEAGVDALRTGGRLVMCGLGPDRVTLPATNELVRREITLLAAYGFRRDTIELVIKLVAAGRLSLGSSISHIVGLEETDDALRMLRDKRDAPRRIVVRP